MLDFRRKLRLVFLGLVEDWSSYWGAYALLTPLGIAMFWDLLRFSLTWVGAMLLF